MNEISAAMIKATLHEMDLLLRPYVCFIHPEILEGIKKIEPDIENKILFKPTELVEKDKVVLMKREQLEEWMFGSIEGNIYE